MKSKVETTNNVEYDLEGLMTDFPTAKELERFVYDQTGVILNVKGLNNKIKYQIAMDVLNGQEPDSKYVSTENPYLERNELIPEEPIKPIPERDPTIPPQSEVQHFFHHFNIIHPDTNMRALDAKVRVMFRKYKNGMITYEIEGPLEQHAIGEKLDKYGRSRPEKLVWVDPRSGEQVVRRQDGSYTARGQALVTYCKSREGGQVWSVWIDKDFAILNQQAIDNPWEV